MTVQIATSKETRYLEPLYCVKRSSQYRSRQVSPSISKDVRTSGYSFKKNLYFIQQDREEPGTVDKHLANVPFEARFAEEEIIATNFSEDPGSDGFVMNSAPLFEVYNAFSAFVCVLY